MAYMHSVKLVFPDENEEITIKVENKYLNKAIHLLNEYGIYAERSLSRKHKTKRTFEVFGGQYTTMCEFAEMNGVDPQEIYRYNTRHLDMTKKASLELYMTEKLQSRFKSLGIKDPLVVEKIKKAIDDGRIASITFDSYSMDFIDVFTSDNSSTICTVKHLSDFYKEIK
jgi:hypothetical protein